MTYIRILLIDVYLDVVETVIGIGSLLFNQGSGILFTYSKETNMAFMGFEGIHAGYMIVFLIASVAYLFSWIMIKILVPKYKIIEKL